MTERYSSSPLIVLLVAGGVGLWVSMAERRGWSLTLAVPLAILAVGLIAAALQPPRSTPRREGLPAERAPPSQVVPSPAPAPAPAPDRVALDALADPALLIDLDQRVARVNGPARALLGERIVGEDVRVGLRHPAVIEAIGAAREAAEPATRELMGFGRPENVFRLRAVGLADGRVLLTFTDITQARLTERMRVDFVANASHELKTPLATILGFIETLEGPAAEDEPARKRFLEIMGREARRMSRLIDDLLSLSRIELDKYVSPRTPIDLGPLLADVGKTLAVRLEADGRRLRTEAADALPPVIGDRDQILQVLHNLVSNALKYGRSGTPILVSAEGLGATPPLVRVSVADEGDGIAPEHLPRLTERFYRVDTSRSRSVGGTGLGLAIVKHIVERHRGQLSIVSRPGEGTTVSFTLPQVPAERAADR